MAKSLFTPSYIASTACAIGSRFGFNGAEVRQAQDIDLDIRTEVVFCDRHTILHQFRAAPGYVYAWVDAPCFRKRLIVDVPAHLLNGSVAELTDFFISSLLELIPDGPAGVETSLELI
jgi:hypothetical protein